MLVETVLLSSLDFPRILTTDGDQHGNRRANNVHTSGLEVSEVRSGGSKISGSIGLNQENSLLAKVVVVLQPVEDIIEEE